MIFFNEYSYELQLTRSLYYHEKNEPIDADGFNFLVYLGYLVYNGFYKIGIDLPWERMRKYHYALNESRKQLDIRLVLKKMLYAEKVATAVLGKHKAKVLHLQEPLTLEEAEQIRKDHDFYENLKKYYFHQEEELGKRRKEEMNKRSETHSENRMCERDIEEWSEDEEEEDEKKEYEKMLKNMKHYIDVLDEEAEKGDKVSKRIIEKLDGRIRRVGRRKKRSRRTTSYTEKNING